MSSAVIDPPRPDAHPATRRALAVSRAGAIAVVLAGGTSMRNMRFSARLGLLAVGSAAIGVSVAVTLWNGLGPGPLDVFIGAVRVRTGLPLTFAVWAVVGSMILAAWALGRRPGAGTLIAPFIIGPVMQVAGTALSTFEFQESWTVRVIVHVLAICGIGLGAGALIVSRLGAGSGELLAAAASDRAGRPEPRVRTGIEVAWLVVGVALGGPFGLGTVLLAVLIGPAVAAGYRLVDGAVATGAGRSHAFIAAANERGELVSCSPTR